MELKEWLSPHGRSTYMAQWVVETKSQLLETSEYKDNKTVQMWIAASQEILDNDKS